MTGEHQLDTFERHVRDHWEQEGYDVLPGDGGLVASRDGEMRLLETYPAGDVTEADIDDAVSRLIESTEITNITLVVGGEVPPSLYQETEQWDVTLVEESDLHGATNSGSVDSADRGTEPGEDSTATTDDERRTLIRETGAFVLEAVLVLLLASVLGLLLFQVLAMV